MKYPIIRNIFIAYLVICPLTYPFLSFIGLNENTINWLATFFFFIIPFFYIFFIYILFKSSSITLLKKTLISLFNTTIYLIILIFFVAVSQTIGKPITFTGNININGLINNKTYFVCSWCLINNNPKVGDIVLYNKKVNNEPKQFIGRVAAVPRDNINISDQKVLINGINITEKYNFSVPKNEYGGRMLIDSEYFIIFDRENSFNGNPELVYMYLPFIDDNIVNIKDITGIIKTK